MAREIRVIVSGDSAGLERALGRSSAAAKGFGSQMEGVGKSMEKVGKKMTTHLTLPIVGLAAVMMKTALDGEKSTARLDAAFKNVGVSVAGASKAVDAMQTSGRALGFTNSQIRDSIGSLVTSTGSLSKAHRELAISEDLARFKGVDLSTATRALTMANAGSMRAIKQLGITIIPVTHAVDALKASHMKLTTEQGRAALAAAKLIDKQATIASMLDIVQGKVRGQGAAYAATAAGGMAIFRAQLDNVAEKLGTTLLPLFNKLLGYLTSALQWFDKLSPSTKQWIEITAASLAVIGPVVGLVGALTTALGGLATAAMFLAANPLVLLAAGIVAVGAAMAAAVLAPQQLEAVLQKFGVSATAAANVVRGLQDAFQVFKDAVLIAISAIRLPITTIVDTIKAAVTLIGDLIHGRWGKLWGDFKTLALAPVNAFKSTFGSVMSSIAGVVVGYGSRIIGGLWNGLKAGWQHVTGWLSSLSGFFRSLLGGAGGWLVGIGAKIIQGLWDGMKSMWHKVTGWLGGLGSAISSIKGPPAKDAVLLYPHGRLIIGGLLNGMTSMMDQVRSVGTAIGDYVGTVMAAAIRQAVVKARAALATAVQNLGSSISNFGSATLSGFDAAGGGTASTRALAAKAKAEAAANAAQQLAEQRAANDKAISDAQTKLSTDTGTGANAAALEADKAAIAAAIQAKADFEAQQQQQADATLAAEKQKTDKDNFEKALSELERQAGGANTEAKVKAVQAKIAALFKKYGITPGSVEAGSDWNAAQSLFVAGMGDLKKSMDALVTAISNLASAQTAAAAPSSGSMPHHADGGIIKNVPGGVYRVAEAGHPEAIIPLDPARRGRATQLMAQTASMLGFADGGFVKGILSGKPIFTEEGPQYYQKAFGLYSPFAKKGPYQTKLTAKEESAYRAWVTANKVPTNPNAKLTDYDMRGFWKSGGKWAGGTTHFPDTWKTPYDTAFSRQSKYATSDNPYDWSGDTLYDMRNRRIGAGANFADGGIIGFGAGGVPLPNLGPGQKINPTTGTPDVPAFRAAAMYLNDAGRDKNDVAILSALIGSLGPRAQAQAALRHTTTFDGTELRQGIWRAGMPDSKLLALIKAAYPDVTFENGTPGQQISAGQAVSRLPGGDGDLMGLVASAYAGGKRPGSLLEHLTSHAVHFAQGGRTLADGLAFLHKNEAVVPLGRGGGPMVEVHLHGDLAGLTDKIETRIIDHGRRGGPLTARIVE